MSELITDPYSQPIDSLLVLGRGIDEYGELSPTGFKRAEEAVHIARLLVPRVVVFSGGNSWVQEIKGIRPPSEGEATLEHFLWYADGDLPEETEYVAETRSTSTIENMVNSKPLLWGPNVGVLTDKLHNEYGRAEWSAQLVMPDANISMFLIENENVPGALKEEKHTNMATRLAMTGVQPGNDRAIMRRQHVLEFANSGLRKLIGLRGENTASSASATE